MILTARRLALVAGLSLPLAFATASYAQPASPAPTAPPPDAAQHHHRSPEERAAAHAARLRTLLQLRPDQEPALTAFVASMKPREGAMGHEHMDRPAEAALPAPQRMEQMLAHMDKMRADMGQKLEALKAFYGQLSPAQQKVFDTMHAGHGHGEHGGWKGGEHHDGGHGGHGGDGMDGGGQPHG